MSSNAPRYNVLGFLGQSQGYASEDAHALLAVAPLAQLVSFDRGPMASKSIQAEDGVALRTGVLTYAEDVLEVHVERSKASHVKQATVVLRGRARVLRDVRPGDWAAVWLLPRSGALADLRKRVLSGQDANRPEDGLRLLGRVHQVRRRYSLGPDGTPDLTYTIQLLGFAEFDAQLFYDYNVATNDVLQQSVGRYLARIGVEADAWFKRNNLLNRKDNINTVIPDILKLVLGTGVSNKLNAGSSQGLSAAAGAGAQDDSPNAYTVPNVVGQWLGRNAFRARPGASSGDRPLAVSSIEETSSFSDEGNTTAVGGPLAYADLIHLLMGVQEYQAKENDLAAFFPSGAQPLVGSFLPMFPQLVNTPFWSVLSAFLNPVMNEMYTSLRIVKLGTHVSVLPTLTVRQIPFTTDALAEIRQLSPPDGMAVTCFKSLPRWVIPSSLVVHSDVGCSDATRVNLVHVYGSASLFAHNMSVTKQMVLAPPIRDDLDIQRSGPRTLMTTVECSPEDQQTGTRKWMEVIADRSMGSHLTLNGTVECLGLPGPIAEGDNVELDGIVFHIERIVDTFQMVQGGVAKGAHRWRTVLSLSNGVVAKGDGLSYYGIEDDQAPSLDANEPGHGGR